VKGNPTPDPPPIKKDAVNAFCAHEEVPNREPVCTPLKDPEKDPLNVPVPDDAKEADIAVFAVVALVTTEAE